MNKNLLIRHIKGSATAQERDVVVSWINKSKENEMYYISLMNLVICENVSREHPAGENILQGMKEDSFSQIQARIEAAKNMQRADDLKGEGYIRTGANQREEVPQIKRPAQRLNIWKWASGAAVVLLALSVAVNLYQFREREMIVEVHKVPAVSNIMSTYYTENGVKGKVVLPDSSVVWLNSGSKIIYPKDFDSDKRRVSFEGEGYFDVVKNPEWPMEVITPKGMKIEVLGTKFHIKSYDNDEEEQATLFSGRIDVSKFTGSKKVLDLKILKPRESLKFTEQGGIVLTPVADTTKKVAWKRGELLFDQTPMPEVIKMLERWHGFEIIVEDPAVLSYKFTADFSSESIVQILELFHFTSPLDYTVENHKVYLRRRKV